jgi:NADH-quinone oxidoreductase subunit L
LRRPITVGFLFLRGDRVLTWVFLLVPFLPLVGALIVVCSEHSTRYTYAKLATYPIGAACLGAAVTLYFVTTSGPITIRFYNPDAATSLTIPIGFYIDRLSGVMMTLIAAVSTIIYSYSTNYMYQDRHYRRYLALICLTDFVLICMVSSSNLMMLFLFWQLLSYLLYVLAHNHGHSPTLDGAYKTFTILRIADMAFLMGIILTYQVYGTLELPDLFARATASRMTVALWPGMGIDAATAITLLMFIGVMGKSAQFPLHLWLPCSLFAPTPVTGLLHAGIINAGGFLFNRMAPLFGMSSTTLHVAFVVGTVTAVLGASMMLVQNDIKKTLGFSTIGQMGYMIMECGLGAFSLAVFHLIAHGLFKATAFLNCGNVIQKARLEPHFPHTNHDHMHHEEGQLSKLTWSTGFATTLVIPLLILLVTHGVLRIPLLESQGTVIILFFVWITSSQAILTLTRLRAIASWKVSLVMLLTLLFVVFIYLFAVESFTAFLYPNPAEVASYFKAAALPDWLFDLIIIGATALTVLGWVYLYTKAHGRGVWMPTWIDGIRNQLYVALMNRLYADELYTRFGQAIMRVIHLIDKHQQGWSR